MRLGRYAADGEECEHVAHGHMPAWAQDDPRAYWQAADEHERANGRLYSEIQFTLPRELDARSAARARGRICRAGVRRRSGCPIRSPSTAAARTGRTPTRT